MEQARNTEIENQVLTLAVVLYFYSILFDLGLLRPFSVELAFDKDLMTTLFQVQASIATLGIAIISILSGTFKETYFGIPVSHYITHLKPNLFKHKNIIFAELTLLLFSYAFIILTFFNSVVITFVISTAIIGIMVHDIFKSFRGSYYLKEEISQYCLSFFRKDCLDTTEMNNIYFGINYDIAFSLESNQLNRIKDNLFLLNCISKCILKKRENNFDALEVWKKTYSSISNKLFKQNNGRISFITIQSLNEIWTLDDKDLDFSLISLWGLISHDLFESLKKIDTEELFFLLLMLRNKIYISLCNSINTIPHSFAHGFSTSIYYFLLKKNTFWDRSDLDFYKELLFREVLSDAFHKAPSPTSEIACQELCHLSKTFIDNLDEKFMDTQIRQLISNVNLETENRTYVALTLVIYLYYLSKKEPLVSIEQKTFYEAFLQKSKESLPRGNDVFLTSNYFDTNFIKKIKSLMKWWEKFEDGKAKSPIMEGVIDEFLLYYLLTFESNNDFISRGLDSIIQNRYLSFYEKYFPSNNRLRFQTELDNFFSLFPKRKLLHANSLETIDRFRSILETLYKNKEFNKVKKIDFNETLLEFKLQSTLNEFTKKLINPFSKKTPNISTQTQLIIEYNHITSFLDNSFAVDLCTELQHNYVLLIISLTKHLLNIKHVNNSTEDILDVFLNQFDTSPVPCDTLVGYRSWFFLSKQAELFHSLEKRMHRVKSDLINDCIIALNSSSFYFKINSVNVHITTLTTEEMLTMAQASESGKYKYNITNNIYLDYTKDELFEYLTYARKMIRVSISYEYGFHYSNELIGVGVIIKPEDNIE